MRNCYLLRIASLLVALWVVSGGVGAVGLGKMTVHSALGQPLRAEIELLSVQPEDVATMRAGLASAEAYRQARMEWSDTLRSLQFNIDRRADGRYVLRISSSTPLNDVFLDMLVELSWSSGRLLREYTVLLDPLTAPELTVTDVVHPRVTAPPAETAAHPADAPAPRGVGRSMQRPDEHATGLAPTRTTYGPVRRGETLRDIADKVRYADVTPEMMMAGLFQANRDAFLKGNLNLLKRGQVLSVPERDQVMRMFSPDQARALVREHSRRWQRYRGEVAATAAQRPPMAAPDSGRIEVAQPPGHPTPAPTPGRDVLRLSKGGPAAADTELTQRIRSLEEELAARNHALQEANDRIGQLERTVKDLQRLLELKAQGSGQPMSAHPADAPQAGGTPARPEANGTPALPGPPKRDWVDTLLADPVYLGGGAAVVLLGLLLGVMVARRRRRKDQAAFEQDAVADDGFTSAAQRSGVVAAALGAGAAAAAVASSQAETVADFSPPRPGAIDAREVDPIAEAEAYMAYGRDIQAEETLKEALAKEPGRQEIALKLLEIYAARKEPAAFEAQASALYARLGGLVTPEWQRVAEMGRALDPANPLYAEVGPSAAAPGAAASETPVPEPTPAEAATPALDFEVPDAPVFSDSEPGSARAEGTSAPADEGVMTGPAPDESERPSAFEATPQPGGPDGAGADFDFEPADEVPGETEPELDLDIAELDLSGLEDAREPTQTVPATPSAAEVGSPASSLNTPTKVGVADLPKPDGAPARPTASSVAAEGDAPLKPEGGEVSRAATADVPDFGFTDIDLELGEDAKAADAEPVVEGGLPAVEEIQITAPPTPAADAVAAGGIDPELWEEVNTKLDLARAYLEMGDKEGAREILLEVQNEGDAQQRQEAGRLLAETG